VLDFFKSLFRPAPASGETAKERLRLVLLSDHLSLAPDVVESLKRDLLEVISRYVEIDFDNADVTFEQREREVAMLANIPITAVRERPRPSGDLPFASIPPLQPDRAALEAPAQPVVQRVEQPVAQEAVEPPVAQESAKAPAVPAVAESAEAHAAVDAAASDGRDEPQLELATASTKPKPARSGNAAGSRRRRRKKYAAAAATTKAKHSAPQQQLGGSASAQA
jgi:cell division topological specificity factor